MSWTANSEGNLAGYYLYRDTSSGGSFPLIATITAPTRTYTDTGLNSITTYYYKVSAYDTDSHESAASTAVSAKTLGGGAVILGGGGGGAGLPQESKYEVSQGTKPTMTKAQLIASIQTQLNALIAQLNTLVAQLKAQGVEVKLPPGLVISAVARFNADLELGMKSDDVRSLQESLAKDKDVYPEGLITGYFGPMTQAAVKKFQAKYGIPSVGRVGPMTRAKLNELFGK